MAKRTNDAQPLSPPKLLISREEAFEKITQRIELGNQIKNRNITSNEELKQTRSEYYSWYEYNEELLSRMFDNSSIRDGYRRSGGIVGYLGERPLAERIQDFRDDVDYHLRKLESLRKRLELIEELPRLIQPPSPSQQRTPSKKVFVVHGHDDGAREAVARFIQKLGLDPIILSEQPNVGRTIIEKFETSSEAVGYAVVLLTPDDMGYQKEKPDEIKARARQNVILELGYFIAKLGRSRVCALYKGDVEIPSDYHGVLFLKMDSNWQILLAQEIRQVIKDIDLNKVFAIG